MEIWIGVKVSIREGNLGFISGENYRWGSKNEGIFFGIGKRICFIRYRGFRYLIRIKKWNVLYLSVYCLLFFFRCMI